MDLPLLGFALWASSWVVLRPRSGCVVVVETFSVAAVGDIVVDGGGGIARRTELSTAVSGRILPPWMKRRRRRACALSRRERIRCFRETTVVEPGRGMSSSRSGRAALNRTVRSKGGGGGVDMAFGSGDLRVGAAIMIIIIIMLLL